MLIRSFSSAALVLGIVLAACGSGTEATGGPSEPPLSEEPAASSAGSQPGTEATPSPAGTAAYAVGDVITISQDGEPWADFSVLEVQQATEFTDPDGIYNDTPQTEGYVFLSARVRYEALTDGVEYNQFDFQIFVGGQAVDSFAFVLNGPEPELSSGTLPQGRTAEGWLVYEVPPTGQVLLSYTGNIFLDEAPVFEVVLRES